MEVVVVESPAKAKTLARYLGDGYRVLATYGHVSDLPAKDGSVDPARDFAMVYATPRRAARAMRAVAAALEDADALVLATDPDREGEAIAWQVLDWLRRKDAIGERPVRRVAFHEITPDAVRDAMASPREIDMDLVRAQQARRALDYLVGFRLSRVLWRKLPGSRSAGRVQSVALRLVCEREAEIEAFEPEEYWTVDAAVTAEAGSFTARLVGLDGKELERLSLTTGAMAEVAAWRIGAGAFRVAAVEQGEVRRDPPPPFTTSTLQQEASRELGFGVRRTMRLAQTLYEGVDAGGGAAGLITYMRTDSTAMSKTAVSAVRALVRKSFGADWLPRRPRVSRARARNAQEAHEAIRPTDFSLMPETLEDRIGDEEAALYALIWKRAVASQMAAARLHRVRAGIATEAGDVVLSASGSSPLFDGFLRIYREGPDEDGGDEHERPLPAMEEGERVFVSEVRPERRFTRPPARYTEAGLVRRLEELGIGRPSTYAAIVGVLRERDYVVVHNRRFVPVERGRVVTAFLERYFGRWVAYGFTDGMERELDRVARGEAAWKGVLHGFWGAFEAALEEAGGLNRAEVREALEDALGSWLFGPAGEREPRSCPSCADGKLTLKIGRHGAFVGCSAYPRCRYSRPLARGLPQGGTGTETLGDDPASGLALTLRMGRHGLYVQLGEDGGRTRAQRASVPKGMGAEEVTPDVARALLALPRTVGVHPDSGETILAGIGRYGAWLKHGRRYVPLPEDEDVLTVGLNRAVMLIAAKEG